MRRIIQAAILFGFILIPMCSFAITMTGGDYQIYSDAFSILDGSTSTGGAYTLSGSGWQGTATTTMGGNFGISGGFQAETIGILTYMLSKQSIDLGTLSTTGISSDSVIVTVSTDSPSGYTMTMSQDGRLRSPTDGRIMFADVTGGAVTPGVEGYGIRTSGGSGRFPLDTAIYDGMQVAFANSIADHDQTTVEFRASIAPGTRGGAYQHTVTFTLTINP